MNSNNPKTWWYWELLAEDRNQPVGVMQSEGARAELRRRNELYMMVAVWLGVIAFILDGLWKVVSD
jgi:hypothetical protein